MSFYFFDTVTAAQASGFNGATDTLVFGSPGDGARLLRLRFKPDDVFGPESITVTALTSGHSVTFGGGLAGASTTLPDSSLLFIGHATGDSFVGGTGNDGLWGGAGVDTLDGGAGRDVLAGGVGADLLRGGEGGDTFLFEARDSGVAPAGLDRILDWSSSDLIAFPSAATAADYVELTSDRYDNALAEANARIASGAANYVAVQVGADVVVFADSAGDNGQADDAVLLPGRTLADINATNIVAQSDTTSTPTATPATPTTPTTPTTPATPAPVQPALPTAPTAGVGGGQGRIHGDMDQAHLTHLLDAVITDASTTFVVARLNDISLRLDGFGFSSDGAGNLTGGTATAVSYQYGAAHGAPFSFIMAIPQISLVTLATWAVQDATQTFFNAALSGSDSIAGSVAGDLLRGLGGSDLIHGGGGGDTIWGGDGNDVIYAHGPGAIGGFQRPTYLRGEAGNDYIIGGSDFDDINGNPGNDTASGGLGDDWVVGGKDNDLLFGDAGSDLVYGNIGDDTCVGGDGHDIVRGGQQNDLIFGGPGDDYVSGDKGDDTVSGGAGADIFHTFGDAGLDRVPDFNLAEGDRVQLDPGTQYTAAQVGGDTVISMTGGGQMILVGVTMSALTPGWIFGA